MSRLVAPTDSPRTPVASPTPVRTTALGDPHDEMVLVPGTAWQLPALPRGARDRWSMERRLPLLFFALLAALILSFGTSAYRGVRDAAVARATERVASLVRELAPTIARSTGPRSAALRRLARDPAVVEALRSGSTPPALAGVLAARAGTADSLLIARELWTAAGARAYATAPVGQRDSLLLAAVRGTPSVADTTVRYSVLYSTAGETHAWGLTPAVVNDSVVGMVAELRRITGSARTEETIRRLTGEDVRVYFTSRGSSDWATVVGAPVAAPFELPPGNTTSLIDDRAGHPHFVVPAAVAGTPWLLVLAQSEASIMQEPREFLRQLVTAGLLLLAVGTVAAWLMSRRETRPLAQLREAAESVARGDYSRQVSLAGGAEMAALAHTFNAMATRIGDTHAVLAHQNAALQRANDAKSRFLAMMSHELRTPLNAIGGYADLIALGIRGPVTETQLQDLTRIRHNKDQLLTIIADVLHFSRADAGHLALHVADVSLADQFTDVTETLSQQFTRKGVVLSAEPTDAVVHADPARLRQVLCNLLTNALQFTEAGGTVRLSARVMGSWTHIEVRDSGIGIPADQHATIFEPFMQVDSALTRRVGGTGLGLSIVHQLTTAMGGTVSVTSTPGAGSAFIVALPTAHG
jgi:signal transduction histidine kinase